MPLPPIMMPAAAKPAFLMNSLLSILVIMYCWMFGNADFGALGALPTNITKKTILFPNGNMGIYRACPKYLAALKAIFSRRDSLYSQISRE